MKRLIVVLAVVGTCGVVLLAVLVAGGEARRDPLVGGVVSSATVDATAILRGTAPAGATTIRAFARAAEAEVGEVVETVELPVVIVDRSSQFEVQANLTALPAGFLSSDRWVDIQVRAETANGILWVSRTSVEAGGKEPVDVGSLTRVGRPPIAQDVS
ncbi:hypothetical protein F0U44_04645 [Nocardioides humilatus]|uniref:Uncharacterized protein n=1 Tax=Nocardioides humilatus TaxID=2607660 RepID=A0A5B1LPU1_9ACTN|nr:hypothetical protein [Nocardioides humilatus]KAA1421577.1 hypothetical protein F0U44_04645 [Nocardioides humilatus]